MTGDHCNEETLKRSHPTGKDETNSASVVMLWLKLTSRLEQPRYAVTAMIHHADGLRVTLIFDASQSTEQYRMI